MRCSVIVEHVGRDSVEGLKAELSSTFGSESRDISELHSIADRFSDAVDLEEAAFFVGQSVSGAAYAFLKIDRHVTQIFAECTSGPVTLSEFQRIISNGIRAITRSQGFPWTCRINTSLLYEDRDEQALALEVQLERWYTRFRRLVTKHNLALLVLTYIVAVLVAYGTGLRSWLIFVQPSLYAVLAIVVYGVLGAVWSILCRRMGVRICERSHQ